jgi:hypothetical protein
MTETDQGNWVLEGLVIRTSADKYLYWWEVYVLGDKILSGVCRSMREAEAEVEDACNHIRRYVDRIGSKP